MRYYAPDGRNVTRQVHRLVRLQGLQEPPNVLAYKYAEPGSPARFLTQQKEIWPTDSTHVPAPMAYAERFWSSEHRAA